MRDIYEKYIDLNLLRVFAAVAETGSVTQAASRLYLTQPAVSAALRRLTQTVGGALLSRQGRGLVLTRKGERLRDALQVHLSPLIEAALTTPNFKPSESQRTLRLGLSDAAELWLLPKLLQRLGKQAPLMRVIALPVQFRTVGHALLHGLDAAVTVADELPSAAQRQTLFHGGFVCLYDRRQVPAARLTCAEYFAGEHVVVSYNGDLRGVVEDVTGKQRRVRCSVSSFASIGAILDGSALIATVPELVAHQLRAVRPYLHIAPVPLTLRGAPLELLWPAALEDDAAGRFLRETIVAVARELPSTAVAR